MARVLGDAGQGFVDDFRFAFEHLHETAVGIKEHAGDAGFPGCNEPKCRGCAGFSVSEISPVAALT